MLSALEVELSAPPERVVLGGFSQGAMLATDVALRAERAPTAITLELCQRLGIEARVLPMSDDPVRTIVNTESGAMRFQDYFMDLKCEPAVRSFQYGGADGARLSDAVLDALHATDLEAVVLCPCNPYHTIQPILAVSGMREVLRKRGAPVVAVSPIIGGRALQGSAAKMMQELGREVSARASRSARIAPWARSSHWAVRSAAPSSPRVWAACAAGNSR